MKIENVNELDAIHAEATRAAIEAVKASDDIGCCGFAWCEIYKVRSNSKLGKKLKELGWYKSDYYKRFELTNPGMARTQSIDTIEKGAYAYAKVFAELSGITIYCGSRVD